MSEVTGVSNNGNIQEALDDAVDKAMASTGSTLVQWKMKDLSGNKGGVVGDNEVSITIEITKP